ncbi:hypothetical protein ABL78_4823 [Leptomonas seymouri]|uniref:Uncharacterized protein n=1 Tax=Leptomonas seymouri TaxID=5684 RepID=A0A0N1I4D6_LEPSE|nr:hypothetical protein ABL78_4823 [Leptomonas seymouri]|eukprot:KPI86131.1 hypothetical protein ABL78_4823 [Leptomonas seymouri]
MDVKLSTIVSRFPFPFRHLHDDDEEDWSAGNAAVRGVRRDAPVTVSSHPTEEGMDGAYAYVPKAAAASPTPSTEAHRLAASRKRVSRGEESLDLTKLASCMWNAELQRSATTAAPTVCVLRPPPFVFDNTAYRGASVYVLPSGVVRLVTYGSVAATQRIARRVQQMLSEAYWPPAARSAAREERRLLRAVFDTESFGGPHGTLREVPQATESVGGGLSLAAALSSDDLRSAALFQRTRPPSQTGRASCVAASQRNPKETKDMSQTTPAVDACKSLDESLKVDFIQSVATPRWGELAGLREVLFAESNARSNAEAAPPVVSEGVAVGQTRSLADAHGTRSAPSAISEDEVTGPDQAQGLKAVIPLNAVRASVNVRGDAPLAWWGWYLAASSQRGSDGHLMASSPDTGPRVVSADVASTKDQGEKSLATTAAATEQVDGTSRFWTCAGHREVSPTSPHAVLFVRYLQHKRVLVAHHVVSFKVRRNASQSSIQLLLEWNSAAPPPPSALSTQQPGLMALRVSLQSSRGLPPGSANVATTSTAAKAGDDANPRAVHASGAMQPASAVAACPQQPNEAWAPEASVSHLFLESTFIAESVMPYGLELARASTGREDDVSALPARNVSSLGPSAPPLEKAESLPLAASALGDSERGSVLTGVPPLERQPLKTGANESFLSHGVSLRQQTRTTEKAAAATAEQVSCLIHRTGRVQLSTGTEAAIHQVCEVLLIPFLMATAEMVW